MFGKIRKKRREKSTKVGMENGERNRMWNGMGKAKKSLYVKLSNNLIYMKEI